MAALHISAKEFVVVRSLLSDQALADPLVPFNKAKTEQAVRFADAVTAVRASGFTIAELEYLLLGRTSNSRALSPAGGTIAALLTDIRAGLQKIADENQPSDDPTGEVTRKR